MPIISVESVYIDNSVFMYYQGEEKNNATVINIYKIEINLY